MDRNIYRSKGSVTSLQREKLLGQSGCVIWLTGLSASGKSTIAMSLEEKLFSMGRVAYVLDGDNIRHGLCRDLGFSEEARTENIRRISEVAALFMDAGIITITAFISPYAKDRLKARKAVANGKFIEVLVDTSIFECEKRDPKGLYVKARKGEISDFTGINSTYEQPTSPEICINTEKLSVKKAVEVILNFMKDKKLLES